MTEIRCRSCQRGAIETDVSHDGDSKKSPEATQSIGYSHLKDARLTKRVPVAPGVVVGDYCPFCTPGS